VIVVGLGRAAALSLAALRERVDVEIVAGIDPRGAVGVTLPASARVLSSLEELPEADLALVATPTPTHVELCLQLLERRPGLSLLLCEKPVALTAGEVERLLAEARRCGVELRTLLHFAFAAEVQWLAGRLSRLGGVVGVDASFEDPYGDALAERTAVLTSSWVDSGINALSVLARFVRLQDAVPSVPPDPAEAVVEVRFAGGRGVVRTSWLVERARKQTRLVLGDSTVVELDHRAGTVRSGGRVLYRSQAADPGLERYRRMLAAHLDDDQSVHRPDEVVHLHRLLERGAAAA
jgi:predicted dehydrogenase